MNLLHQLPNDIFITLGNFLTYQDISRSLISGISQNITKNLKIAKSSIFLPKYTKDLVQSLYQSYPDLKAIGISDWYRCFSMSVDEDVVDIDLSVLYQFNKLQDLLLMINTGGYQIYFTEWHQFQNLQSLTINFKTTIDKITLSRLRYLSSVKTILSPDLNNIETFIGYLNKDSYVNNLRYIEISINNIIVYSDVYLQCFQALQNAKNLEVLILDETQEHSYLNNNTIPIFPKNLKMLRLGFIGYDDHGDNFRRLSLQKLEYLCVKNIQSLINIGDWILTLPDLKYLEITEIKFRKINPDLISLLKKLKAKGVSFSFIMIQLKRLERTHLEYKDDTYTQRIEDETKIMNTIFPELQQIFGFGELDGHGMLKDPLFTEERWLKEHGFYFPEEM